MFRPNLPVVIQVAGGYTQQGAVKIARTVTERGAIVQLNVSQLRSPVRTDRSASKGAAQEELAQAIILLGPNTAADIDDLITIAGVTLIVTAKFPRYSVHGRLDHNEMQGKIRGLK